jgi:3-hydroxypropanoate dehydrogenase
MPSLSTQALGQLFTEARTHRSWLSEPIADDTLRALYDLLKWGPTSSNTCPARFLFIKSAAEKERLLPCLAPGNVKKVQAAPVTVIVANDAKFYEQLAKLSPRSTAYRDMLAADAALADETAFRNGTLQGGYLILAARALGLDCGPMSGFDNAQVDEIFFKGTTWKSNFLCNLGHGDASKLHPREPRLEFAEACRII